LAGNSLTNYRDLANHQFFMSVPYSIGMSSDYGKLNKSAMMAFYAGLAIMIGGGVLVMLFSSAENDLYENLGFTIFGLGGTMTALGITLKVEANKQKPQS